MASDILRAKKLEVIKKTTFNVYCTAYSYYSYGDEEVYDGWMDRKGYVQLNETHHHVEAALDIIRELDEDCKASQKRYKKFKSLLDLAKSSPNESSERKYSNLSNLTNFLYEFNLELELQSSIYDISSLDQISENIEKAEKKLSRLAIKPHFMSDFKKVNKNCGLDAGEFLIANLGYIAIEGRKAIYNCSKEIGTTIKQRNKLHCSLLEDGILIDNDSKAAKERDMNKERQWVLDNREYFSDWRNQFHCPSGCIRAGYARFKALASKHGIQTDTRRSMCFSSY